MFRRARTLPVLPALLVAALLGALLSRAWARPPDAEPPLAVRVTLGGVEHLIPEGEETLVDVGGKKIPVEVRVLGVRILETADGVRFPYPAALRFAYAQDADQAWTLTGEGFSLQVRRVPGRVVGARRRVEIMRDVWRKRFPQSTIAEDVPFVLGGETLQAIRQADEEGPGRINTFVGFDAPDAVYLLTVDQAMNAAGETTRESQEALRLLAEEFRFPPK